MKTFGGNWFAHFRHKPFMGLYRRMTNVTTECICAGTLGKRWMNFPPCIISWLSRPSFAGSRCIGSVPSRLASPFHGNLRSDDPIVLEFTLYILCPGSEDDGWDEKRVADRSPSSTTTRGRRLRLPALRRRLRRQGELAPTCRVWLKVVVPEVDVSNFLGCGGRI